jgi:signal transduction histidine kinase
VSVDSGACFAAQCGAAVFEYAGTFLLLIALAVSAALWLRSRNGVRALARECALIKRTQADLAALLDTLPIASMRFAADPDENAITQAYADFLAGLIPADAARLEAARRALKPDGTGFSAAVRTLEGGEITIEGRTTTSGERILWLLDGCASAAREREAALREMIEAVPMPVWRRDGAGEIVETNRAFAAVVGDHAAALPRGPANMPPTCEPSAAEVPDVDRQVLDHVVVDGARRLFSFTELPRTDGGAIGFAVDRTEIEAAQGELWRHINAQGEVLESIRAGVAIYGAERRLKYFNSAFAAIWGIDEDWLDGEPRLEEVLEWLRQHRRIPEFIDFRAYRHDHIEMFTALLETRQEMMHLPDGRTLQLSITPHPLGGLIFLYEDVTDYLALECSFNTLAQVQRATLDHLFEGIAVFGPDGRLKLHNPVYRTIWGLSAEDVAGEPHVSQLVDKMRPLLDDGSNWTTARQAIIDRIAAQVPASGLINRCDGSLLQAATVPLPDGDVLLTYLDVSDSARVEQALREKNEALETADRLKSEFIANVSYELRTPLNSIIGFTEILDQKYFGEMNERQLEYTQYILESSHHLMGLINDIIDLATIEAGYLHLELGRVDIDQMLRAVAGLTEERARNRDLHLTLRCSPEVGMIEADERRLKQALFNLVSNAIKFTPPGGTISLEAENRGRHLLLSVADTGIGIAPTDHDRVFEKFERGVRQAGAGIGLSLVKKLIELHGGSVGIESALDRGTRILCRLPAGRRCRRRSVRRGRDRPSKGTIGEQAGRGLHEPAALSTAATVAASGAEAASRRMACGTPIRASRG